MPVLVRDKSVVGNRIEGFNIEKKLQLLVCAYIVDGANHMSMTASCVEDRGLKPNWQSERML